MRATGTIVGIGFDMVEIGRVDAAIRRWERRFLDRLYTVEEQACCRGQASSLAGRLAAKEAVLKAMGTGLRFGNWREIAVTGDALGAPRVTISGRLAEEARCRGIEGFLVSITHTGDLAAAVALARGG
ncbi:MAG: holo-ACP synthase [bacterium]|nr:holo-ACP synthase [bacterium]